MFSSKHGYESSTLFDDDGLWAIDKMWKIPLEVSSFAVVVHLKVKATYDDDEQLIVFWCNKFCYGHRRENFRANLTTQHWNSLELSRGYQQRFCCDKAFKCINDIKNHSIILSGKNFTAIFLQEIH